MSNIDNFLANISQEINMDQSDKFSESKTTKVSKPKSKKNKIEENVSFDTTNLFGDTDNNDSVLNMIFPSTSDDSIILNEAAITVENTDSVGVDVKTIRAVIREELDAYFKEKMILEESSAGNAQIIFLKVGNSLFKGNMEFVKSV